MATAIHALRQQIASCENTLRELRQQLAEAEHIQQEQQKVLRQKPPLSQDPLDHDMNFGVPDDFRSEVFAILEQEHAASEAAEASPKAKRWPLEKNEYKRYGRQLIMPEIGLQGRQQALLCLIYHLLMRLRRTASLEEFAGPHRWRRRIRVPGSSVPRRRWRGYCRTCRRRCR